MVEIHMALHWTSQRPEMTEKRFERKHFFGQIKVRPWPPRRFIVASLSGAPMSHPIFFYFSALSRSEGDEGSNFDARLVKCEAKRLHSKAYTCAIMQE